MSEPVCQLGSQLPGRKRTRLPGASKAQGFCFSRFPQWLRWQGPPAEPGLRTVPRRWNLWQTDGLCSLRAESVICEKVKLGLSRTQNH